VKRRAGWLIGVLVLVAAATIGVLLLLQNIQTRKREGEQHYFKIESLDESVVDPGKWGRNFPRQYDTYRRTVDQARTRYGGSEAFSKLQEDKRYVKLFAGYAFSIDYREERGHAYMLSDQDTTERVKQRPQPGACLHCHASVTGAYREAGREAGVASEGGFEWPQVMKGFELLCAKPWKEAREHVDHPVSCIDCHDPESMQLRVTRPGFLNGIRALAESNEPAPHLESITRWRGGARKKPYDPNEEATRQEMRSFVCGQCHVEYYFRGEGKTLTYPWYKGLVLERVEEYYDEQKFTDWKHAESGAPMLKAQHPEFELWNQGIHARSKVACADCHMPYLREGAVKISSHHVRSPLLDVSKACQTCHRQDDDDLIERVQAIQNRTHDLMDRAKDAVIALVDDIAAAANAGVAPEILEKARRHHRAAHFRLDFVNAENSMGFHAPQESARILGLAIDEARKGQILLPRR
jgi:nitrite reductase (cytochrome c-552)